jgi:hypothetical protein
MIQTLSKSGSTSPSQASVPKHSGRQLALRPTNSRDASGIVRAWFLRGRARVA